MTKILQIFKNYQKLGNAEQRAYISRFEEKMIYRTTKTENPETTPQMVREILHKFKHA